jgi:DNA-binding CsgD family transcriptional regulator
VQKILTLNKEKKRIALIRNFIIVLILLLAATGYLYFNRIRLKLNLKQQQAQADAENAREQLTLFTENLREKTKLIENLQGQLLNKELNEEQIEHIHELSQHSILTDEDWEQFKSLFNKVYPAFLIDLKLKVSDITLAEQRMAALIKLKMTPKDAATMLGISQNSVYKSRQRLRQRLGLEHDEDLEIFFST